MKQAVELVSIDYVILTDGIEHRQTSVLPIFIELQNHRVF